MEVSTMARKKVGLKMEREDLYKKMEVIMMEIGRITK